MPRSWHDLSLFKVPLFHIIQRPLLKKNLAALYQSPFLKTDIVALHVYICQKYIFPFLQYLLINNLFAIQSVRCLTFIGFFHSAGIVVWVLTSFYFYWKWYAKLSHQSFDGTFLPKNMLSWPSTRIPPIEWFLKGYKLAMHSVATKRAHAYMVEIPMPYSFCKTFISMRWP